MSQAETFSLSEVMSDEIAALVKAGFYSSKSDVAKDALRCLFEHKPELKITAAVELYKEGKISLGRAAEIADMSSVDFTELLAERGIKRVVTFSPERIKKGLDTIKKARNVSLLDFFGKWPGSKKELDIIKKNLERERKSFKTRMIHFT